MIIFFLFQVLFAFDEGERISNLVLRVLCLTRQRNSRFSVIVVDAKLVHPPPPEDFCRGLRSAGNWYGLWSRFHDAQAPNGQFSV